jgi:HAD superfamily hydrolase (TIGR01459 family)
MDISMAVAPPAIRSLDELTDRYDAIFCDVWGVLHNGVEPFWDAAAALGAAREKGVAVVLITNSPRPSGSVVAQLASIGVPAEAWDGIVTSGDVTRDLIAEAPRKLFHIGAERDLAIFEGLDVELVEEFEASAVVCTGLADDDGETPDDYADMLRRLRARDLPFICANPDIVVEKGDRLVWCAGALARDYAQLGGRTQIAGKPHSPIYDVALNSAADILGRPVDRQDVLAIGDGVLTDVKGAVGNGVDVLFVSAGIHVRDYGDPDAPDAALLAAFLDRHGHQPVAYIPRLR